MDMRLGFLFALAACGGGTASPYEQASLVVRGRAHASIIGVERIYKGACDTDIVLESEPAPSADAIYFLDRAAAPGRWRVIAAEAATREPEVIAALALPAT